MASGTNWHDQFERLFGHFGKSAVQQGDGNLVIQGFDGSFLWTTGFSGLISSVPCRFPASKTRVQFNTDMPGQNLPGSPFPAASYGACGQACADNGGCGSWAFTDNSRCWLKFGVPFNSPLTGVTSGIIIR